MELSVRNLCFAYPNRSLFWEYSFTVGAGITWLRGRNGAGKTTLLKLLAGSLHAPKGDIFLDGCNLRQQGFEWRLQCFWCSSETPDFAWLTVQEFLDLHMSLYPAARAADLNINLAAFGLLPMLKQTIDTLSLGQHKKMYLSLALALPVKLLLIDEPFNALDVEAAYYLREQLSDPARQASQCILMTSHVAPDVPLVGEMIVDD
ncbi:ABC transporter ATP-binding protein [Undibacterium sp. Di27W]|uniref:ABC transporter ATP-binding protein n=1 Tax=Undibacterium sp. Di27W TaxID=3413036 RepID=UPI003BF0866F